MPIRKHKGIIRKDLQEIQLRSFYCKDWIASKSFFGEAIFCFHCLRIGIRGKTRQKCFERIFWVGQLNTVNLAPADTKKIGAAFNLSMAIGSLTATQVVQKENLKRDFILVKLSHGGKLKTVRGAPSISVAAKGAVLGRKRGILVQGEIVFDAG